MNAAEPSNPKPLPVHGAANPLARDQLRILVGIASFGDGHLPLLKRLIDDYITFSKHVSILVFSDGPKDLGPNAQVIVGLPSKDPWSLPFAHKKAFADRVNDFDLFIYTEDDIGFRAEQIDAFLHATAQLNPDEIAGYLRYEVDHDGTRYLTEPWQHFHWLPDSAKARGEYTVAEFTNEHAGFYVLNQDQLKRAIASGGFVRPPYTARYRLPETAATDPYTSCGFRKVIPVSHLEEFLVHHIPNKYVKDLPVTSEKFAAQIETLGRIQRGQHPAVSLCAVEPTGWFNGYQKSFYEKPCLPLIELIPSTTNTVLSIGAGWGSLERELQSRGMKITALPLDSVIGAGLVSEGIEVIWKNIEDAWLALEGRTFDCVVITNLLHLQPDPAKLLRRVAQLISSGGCLIASGPNFDRLPRLIKRILGIGEFRKLKTFADGGISPIGPNKIQAAVRTEKLSATKTIWLMDDGKQPPVENKSLVGNRLIGTNWISRFTKLA